MTTIARRPAPSRASPKGSPDDGISQGPRSVCGARDRSLHIRTAAGGGPARPKLLSRPRESSAPEDTGGVEAPPAPGPARPLRAAPGSHAPDDPPASLG